MIAGFRRIEEFDESGDASTEGLSGRCEVLTYDRIPEDNLDEVACSRRDEGWLHR